MSELRPWIDAAFGGTGEVRLAPIGAPFQIKVWEALLRVPFGQTVSYGAIARAKGGRPGPAYEVSLEKLPLHGQVIITSSGPAIARTAPAMSSSPSPRAK